jgi:hypothetical protein
MVYNILTCAGFDGAKETALSLVGGNCIKARFGLVILFFLIAIVRKWGAEMFGIGYSFWLSLISGLGVYFLVILFTGSFKFALGFGFIAGLVMGYGSGLFFGGEE